MGPPVYLCRWCNVCDRAAEARVCVKSLQGQNENVVASFELCPVVSDRPHDPVVPVVAVRAVVALPAEYVLGGAGADAGAGTVAGTGADAGAGTDVETDVGTAGPVVSMDRHNKHSLSVRSS